MREVVGSEEAEGWEEDGEGQREGWVAGVRWVGEAWGGWGGWGGDEVDAMGSALKGLEL